MLGFFHIFTVQIFIPMGSNWKPVENLIVKDEANRKQLLDEGVVKLPAIPNEIIKALNEAFLATHSKHEGGMFYSLYSKDYAYRKKTDELIFNTLKPVFDKYFTDYKSSFNLFIVKGAHTAEEFFIHQDPSYCDEYKYSPLHVWIPLEDINENNGALCFVPKTHKLFAPYRNISFAAPFEGIRPFVRKYLKPEFVKAGEILAFDPRVLHNSLPNNTDEVRVVILCGLFHKDAQIVASYKDEEVPNSPVELFEQEEDFFNVYPDFFETCRMRPTTGKFVGAVGYDYEPMTEEVFAALCEKEGIQPVNYLQVQDIPNCKMLGEPVIKPLEIQH